MSNFSESYEVSSIKKVLLIFGTVYSTPMVNHNKAHRRIEWIEKQIHIWAALLHA